MAFNWIRSQEYKGHDLTLAILGLTSTAPTYDTAGQQNGEENTHTLRSAVDSLTTLTVPASATGATTVDAGLVNKLIAAVDIGGGKIYSHDADGVQQFKHVYEDNELTLLNGSTFVAGVNVDFYYLDTPDGETTAGVRTSALIPVLTNLKEGLKGSLDEVPEQEVYNIMIGLGYSRT